MKALHWVWLSPLVMILALGGFLIGLMGWCGDDTDGCRFGFESAANSLIIGLAFVVVMALAIFGVVLGVEWTESRKLRGRVGLLIAGVYLVLIAAYLLVTAVLP